MHSRTISQTPVTEAGDDRLTPLLQLLADGKARTLEALARALDQQRETVSESLVELEGHGLTLTRQGKKISCQAFVPLHADEIDVACIQRSLAADVHVSAVTDSTNTRLLDALRSDELAQGMTIMAAEIQTAGRGRLGRSWHATPGASLAVSFAQLLPIPPSATTGLSLVCGLAVRDALVRQGVEAELKWPNDLLAGAGKVGGILVEMQQRDEASCGVVIGVGLNISFDAQRSQALFGRETALPVADLYGAGSIHPINRNFLVADLAESFESYLTRFVASGFAPMKDAWNAVHAFQDTQISLIEGGITLVTGVARGVDDSGRLMVETVEGMRTVVVGDVSVRSS